MIAEFAIIVQASFGIPVAVWPAVFIITQVPIVVAAFQRIGATIVYDESELGRVAVRPVFDMISSRSL